MLNNESIAETVAELMDDADMVLNRAGIVIDSSIEDPRQFVETIADILDENELDADEVELLRLGASLIESYMQNLDESAETVEGSWSRDQRSAARKSKLGAERARSTRRETEIRKGEKGRTTVPRVDPKDAAATAKRLVKVRAAKTGTAEKPEPLGARLAQYKAAKAKAAQISILKNPVSKALSPEQQAAEKAKRVMKTSYVKPALTQAQKLARIAAEKAAEAEREAAKKKAPNPEKLANIKHQASISARATDDSTMKKAAGESVDEDDALLTQIAEAIDAAGYAIPEDASVDDFLEAVEALVLTDGAVASALSGAAVKMLKSKAAAKLANAGAQAAARKLSNVGPPKVISNVSPSKAAEDVDSLVATMVEMLTNNGYEFEGDAECFDSERFVEAASEIAETDEDLDEDISAWLKNASASARAKMAEASQTGALPKGRGPRGGRYAKIVKRATARKMRHAAKQNPEEAPKKRPTAGWAD